MTSRLISKDAKKAGTTAGLRIGNMFETRYFELFQKYGRRRSSVMSISRRLNYIEKILENKDDLADICTKHSEELILLQHRVLVNGYNAQDIRKMKVKILGEELDLEIIKQLIMIEDTERLLYFQGLRNAVKLVLI